MLLSRTLFEANEGRTVTAGTGPVRLRAMLKSQLLMVGFPQREEEGL